MKGERHGDAYHAGRWLAAAALVVLSLIAFAAEAGSLTRTNRGGFEVLGSGKTWTFGNAKPRPGDVGWVDDYPYSNSGAKLAPLDIWEQAGEPNARGRAKLPIPGSGGRHLPVDVNARIKRPSAAAAIGRFAKRALPVAATLFATYQLMEDLGFTDRGDTDGDGFVNWGKDDPVSGYCPTGPCYWFRVSGAQFEGSPPNGPLSASPSEAALYAIGKKSGTCTGVNSIVAVTVVQTGAYPGGFRYTATCSNGSVSAQRVIDYVGGRSPDTGPPPTLEATEQDLIDAIASAAGWPSSHSRALVEAINAGEQAEHETPTVSGPSSVQGPSSTKQEQVPASQGGGTKTITNNTTYNTTYNQNTVTVTQTTTTTTVWNKPDGTTETTTDVEEEEPPEEKCPEGSTSLDCAELDEPEEEIPRSTKNVEYSIEDLGFGGGSCPASPSWTDRLGTHTLNMGPICDAVVSWVRPLVLAMAALMALAIAVPRTEV